jgi:DNA-directed RNA polymerase subunit RPC12/RpoP
MNEEAEDILVRGVAAAKNKEPEEARHYLEWALRLDPDPDQIQEAWYWLSEVSTNPAEKRSWLENILANNPGDARARRSLAILNGKLDPAEIIDPDKMKQPAAGSPQTASAQRFICPKCGGRMTFTPDGLSLTCEYCTAHEPITPEKNQPGNEDFLIAMATAKGHIAPTQAYTLVCQGCGANFILPPQELTITCPYCGSAYVLKSQALHNLIQPNAIFPLAVSESQAQQAMRDWLESRHLHMPFYVAKEVGVYLPFWDFNVSGQVSWRYLVQEQRQWVEESGEDTVYLTDILAPATKRLCQACLPVAKSYDLKSLVDYDLRYLSNWPAETYQVEVGDASLDARETALAIEKQRARQKVPVAAKNLVFDSSSMLVDSFKLVLLPLWLTCVSREDGRKFDVVINGQTAQVFGEWD